MCPADPVQNAENGLPSGQPLPGPGLADFQIQLLSGLMALTQEMRQQTSAIDRLAQSNEMLVQAMAEGDGMDDVEPSTYMDGSRIR